LRCPLLASGGGGEELGLEVGDALVEEPVGVAGAGEAVFQAAVVLGELADLGPQGVVLGDGAGDAVFGQVVLQVADAAEQLADPAALGGDLGVCPLELALGVERALPPGPGLGLAGLAARSLASFACPAAAAVTSARASAFW
jgi:hypothetical protein